MSEQAPARSRFVRPWPEQPILSGHVYRITDPLTLFAPILGSQGPPQAGYEPWSGLEVRTWSVNDLIPIPIPGPTAQTQGDGSFAITQPPANASVPGDTPSDVRFSLLVTEGSFPFRPLYRSDLSLSVGAAETTELNIWLLTETVDVKDGISAGDVSGTVNGSGLPGNTQITASPSGLSFSGSHLGADVRFGIAITPDTSFDLTTFLDLQLSSWNIHVGWPADWCTNADDILAEIVGGLQNAGSSMNATVLAKMKADLVQQEPILAGEVDAFFASDVSVTFMDVTYPTQHTWAMSNTTDSTVVITGDLCIGYPRHLSWDPSRIPVFEPLRLSRALRPVMV